MPNPSSDTGANPEIDAESLPRAVVEANATLAGGAEADPGFLTTTNLAPVVDTNPPQRLEENSARGISSASGKAVPCTQTAAAADSTGGAVSLRRAGSAAAAMKRELEQQEVPVAKRHKAVSEESQAAMAAIMATARLPTQVIRYTLRLNYLRLSPNCDLVCTAMSHTASYIVITVIAVKLRCLLLRLKLKSYSTHSNDSTNFTQNQCYAQQWHRVSSVAPPQVTATSTMFDRKP